MRYKVLLWGLGRTYNLSINLIKDLENRNELQIVGLTANDLDREGYLDGYPIICKDGISEVDFDFIIILSNLYYDEIVSTITYELGISRDLIIPYRVLLIPFFSFLQYVEIKKQRVTIISNNCWGGILYNTLGMECLSPFKNVSMNDLHYLRAISDLRNNIEKDVTWNGKMSLDVNSNVSVPVLEWGGMEIKANHYRDAKLAISDWNRRKKKINWNRLFFEMYTENKDSEEEFYKLTEGAWRRICFVPDYFEETKGLRLAMKPSQKKFYEAVNQSATFDGMQYKILDFFNEVITKR